MHRVAIYSIIILFYRLIATMSFEAQLALARYQAEIEELDRKEELLRQQFNEEIKKIHDAKFHAMQALDDTLQELLTAAEEQGVKITVMDCSDLRAQIAKVRMEYDLQQCVDTATNSSMTSKSVRPLNIRQNICAIKNVVFGDGVI
jgi:Tfp pilus assembly protein PilO